MSSSEPRRTSAFLAAFSPGSKKSRGGQDAAVPLSPSQPVPVFQFQVDGDDDNGRKDDAVVEKAAEMKQVPPPMLMIDTAESVDDLMNMPRFEVFEDGNQRDTALHAIRNMQDSNQQPSQVYSQLGMSPKTGMRRRNSVLEQMGLGLKKDIDVDVGSRFGNGSRDRLGHGFGQDSPGQRRNSVLGGILGGGTGNVASQHVGSGASGAGLYSKAMTLLDSRMRVPSNFGSQAQMFAGEQENNVSFRKKAIYMHLTIVFGLSLLALVVYDFIVGQWSGSTDAFHMLNSWLVMVTSMHVGVLYLNLLAYIYSNEAGDLQKFKWSNLFIVINFLSFSLRVAFEFTYADYLPEVYTNYVSH